MARGWLFVVCCKLSVLCHCVLLFDACCLMSVVVRSSWCVVCSVLLFVDCALRFVVCCWLFNTGCLLLVVCSL